MEVAQGIDDTEGHVRQGLPTQVPARIELGTLQAPALGQGLKEAQLPLFRVIHCLFQG